MITRAEAVAFIRSQLASRSDWEREHKDGAHHYGRAELRELLDKIYGPPASPDEELNGGAWGKASGSFRGVPFVAAPAPAPTGDPADRGRRSFEEEIRSLEGWPAAPGKPAALPLDTFLLREWPAAWATDIEAACAATANGCERALYAHAGSDLTRVRLELIRADVSEVVRGLVRIGTLPFLIEPVFRLVDRGERISHGISILWRKA